MFRGKDGAQHTTIGKPEKPNEVRERRRRKDYVHSFADTKGQYPSHANSCY